VHEVSHGYCEVRCAPDIANDWGAVMLLSIAELNCRGWEQRMLRVTAAYGGAHKGDRFALPIFDASSPAFADCRK